MQVVGNRPPRSSFAWPPLLAVASGCAQLCGADFDDAQLRASTGGSAATGGGNDGAGGAGAAGGGCASLEDPSTEADDDCDGRTGNPERVVRFGEDGLQYAGAVIVDAAHDVIVSGYFEGTIDFGDGPHTADADRDVYVAKLDGDSLTPLWSRAFGRPDSTDFAGIVKAANGDVLVGMISQAGPIDYGCGPHPLDAGAAYQGTFARLDGVTGDCVFSHRFGNDSDEAGCDLFELSDETHLVVGSFATTVHLEGGPVLSGGPSLVLERLDAAGGYVSAATLPYFAVQQALVDGDDGVWLVGATSEPIDLGGGLLGEAGVDTNIVARFDADGGFRFAAELGEAPYYGSASVALDAQGRALVAVPFSGGVSLDGLPPVTANGDDVLVARFAPDGTAQIAIAVGGPGDQYAQGVAALPDGSAAVVGMFRGPMSAGPFALADTSPLGGAFAFETREDGSIAWARAFGDDDDEVSLGRTLYTDLLRSAAARGDAEIVVAGTFDGAPDLGTGPIEAASFTDVYVARLAR